MAGLRIWHQSIVALEHIGAYKQALASRLPGLVAPGTEIVLHGVPAEFYAGQPPALVLRDPKARHLIHAQALRQVALAEREGFDAVAFVTFAEPFLPQARALLDIPVVSMLESCLLTGCSLARRLALVTLGPGNLTRLTAQVAQHGLGERISGIYALDPAVTEFDLAAAFTAPETMLDNFTRVAQRAIADGAGLIIPAEGVLNEVLAAQGLARIDGAVVLDATAVVLAHAEMLVALRRRCGLGVERRWDHPRAPAF